MKDKQKMILDPACGGRMFYFNKNDDRVLFCDIRNETYDFGEYGEFKVGPDMQIDFTNMPFDNESFKMIIFDPPHLLHSKSTPTGYMKIKYGYLHRDSWKEVLTKGFNECFRVLKAGGGAYI